MRPTRRNPLTGIKSIAIAMSLAAATAAAYERSGPTGDSGETSPQGPPCAVVEKFGGDLQILDATRTRLEDPRRGAAIGCGGWISVARGWILLKHQGGAQIRLGAQTFARLKDGEDQLVLHRGEVHLSGGHGRGGLRAITPNARITLSRGQALVIYSAEEEESQLITLEGSAAITNRFATHKPVVVSSGEGSSLNFKLLRVVPSAPRAVAIAAVRKHLASLKLEGKGRDEAVASVQKRLDRKFASRHRVVKDGEEVPRRAPASAGGSYVRHKAKDANEDFIRRTMARKVAGDEGSGELLAPRREPAGKLKGRAVVVDPGMDSSPSQEDERVALEEAAEKQRLIEELSKIKEEE
jgi:hypothetical protein